MNNDITSPISVKFADYIFKYSSDGIIITDSFNRILSVNKALEEMSGYDTDELKGSNPNIFKSGWKKDAFYSDMWKMLLNDGVWQGEIVNRHKDGSLFTVEVSLFVIYDDNHKIVNFLGILRDMTQSKNQQKKIEKLRYYDFLTNLPNKILFQEKVKSYLKSNNQFALLMVDIHGFKLINQSIGNQEGDLILSHYAQYLVEILAQCDGVLSRFEGDVFAIMLHYEDTLKVSYLANEIIKLNARPITRHNFSINVFCNIGISLYPHNSKVYDELIHYAQSALYKSKEQGKGKYHYYSDEINLEARYRLDIDMNLYNAISNNEFYLVYQPKYSIKDQKVTSCEVLIRWKNRQFGNLNPDQFIPIAEESEYIVAIGSWIIGQVLEDIKRIHHYDPAFRLAINISPKQLNHKAFIATLTDAILDSGIDPSFIELEITETAIIQDIHRAVAMLNEIKMMGMAIAIDDFGTGYASMSYLKKLPVDTIKIDKEFIKDIDKDRENQAIVDAIISLAKVFNLKSVAEGVESAQHKAFLESVGCDILQGYYISKPLLLDDLLYFITK
ncbi:MAG: GGDEF domain-containing protein [Campylobacterales bacterium]|nr:GGDEF domain-containing protein [Campylobacterales bacterium]